MNYCNFCVILNVRKTMKEGAEMKVASTSERLKQIMEQRNLQQVDILTLCKPYCEQYGVPLRKNDISQYVNGKHEPNQKKLTVLAKGLKVSETWLMGYDVDPFENNKVLQEIMNKVLLLDSFDQGRVVGQIDEMLKDPKYHKDDLKTSKGDSSITA